MAEIERPRCETCPYWDPCDIDEDDSDRGQCRRHPPSIPHTEAQQREAISVLGCGDGMFIGWPVMTQPDDWCGEHPDFPAYLAAWRASESDQHVKD